MFDDDGWVRMFVECMGVMALYIITLYLIFTLAL